MGVLSKLKGIFYDEVIVEEPEEEINKAIGGIYKITE